MYGPLALEAVVLSTLLVGCSGPAEPSASSPSDPIARVMTSHQIDGRLSPRCKTAGVPSAALLATATTTVGAVRTAEAADYPRAKLPVGVQTFAATEAVTLCVVNGAVYPGSGTQLAVLAVTEDGNSWWAGGRPN
jgi:hypothetical protein